MKKLLMFVFVGFFAQLMDGSLGMGSGLSTTSFLLAFGVAPAMVSASIHIAELFTTASSGISHYRFGNVDKRLAKVLIIPGSIGAFIGASLLSNLPGDLITPYIAAILLMVGFYVLFIYVFDKKKLRPKRRKRPNNFDPPSKYLVYPLALSGGFLDAIGGGGWGAVNTPVLIGRTRMKPRKVIGSVDASEFAIALSATAGFLISLGINGVNWKWAAALAIGGVIAAPFAAFIVKVLPSSVLGILVGGVIMLTSTNTLLMSLENVIPSSTHDAIYSSIITIWIFSGVFTIWMRLIIKPQKRNRKRE